MNPNFLNKTYESYSSLNFEAYMKEIGLSYIVRSIGKKMKTTETIIDKGNGTYDLVMTSCVAKHVTTFRLGEQITRDLIDGRKNCTSVFIVKGNALEEAQYCPSSKNVRLSNTRIFKENEMLMVLTANKVSATMFYKLIKSL